MVSLAVVVLDVLPSEEAQVALTERDHSIETFLFHRPNEPFGVRVEIGTLRRQPNGLHPAARQDVGYNTGVKGIPVANEMACCSQDPSTGSISVRAICSTHAPPGWGWMPAIWTRRVCSSITKKTRYRFRPAGVSTSTVKKSAAATPAQCASKNVFHGVR